MSRWMAFRALGLSLLVSAPLIAQSGRRAEEINSLGQPPVWQPYAVAGAVRGEGRAWRSALSAGVHRPLTNPVTGLLGLTGEVYVSIDPGVRPGARVMATSRVVGLAAGVDWDERSSTIDGILSFQTAIRRGGVFGRGSMLRVDWLPGRGDAFNVGFHLPVGQPFAGKTRPHDMDVEPPAPVQLRLSATHVPSDAEPALTKVASAAATLLSYTNLYPERSGSLNYGPSYAAVTRNYLEGLAEAFRVASRNQLLGDRIASRARAGLLTDVIIPFDSLFGQVKEDAGSIRPLVSRAHAGFVTWLRDSSRVTTSVQPAVIAVHSRWLQVIEQVHRNLVGHWRDSRLLWLPLQLALAQEDYDEQAEVDALIARAVGRPFTDQNALAYLRSSDIPLEIARSIFAARDYHVLWTHDFAGQRDDTKTVDDVSFSIVADAYLPALTAAIQRYDSTRVLPAYMIFVDQFFYAKRNGRLWMDILENPMHARISLPGPGNNAGREAHLRRRQEQLRQAVRGSWLLQQDAIANGGDRWLADVVRVHVNVMHPSDFSFRSHRIAPPWPFVPDNVMREHRKIVLYDLGASDPYRGAAIIMGVGVGEHYSTATWEDRAIRVRGPAAFESLLGARRALLANGIAERDLPFPFHLRSRPTTMTMLGDDSGRGNGRVTVFSNGAVVADPVYVGRALQVHNQTGFAEKESSVARAMLYNLAPPGSVIIVPDPIWVSDSWAAMLASAAARGCRVFVISPSKENNPNPQSQIRVVQNDVMSRLLASRERMREQLIATGGELRVGVYTARAANDDVAGRAREVRDGLRRAPWIRELIPFDNKTMAVLDRAIATNSDGKDATVMAHDEKPRWPMLHQKTQLIARPGAIASLVRQPGWDETIARAMQVQSQQTAKLADQLGWTTPEVDSAATLVTDALIRGYERSLSEADRKAVSFYFSVGSQNQDPRGLMLDGEASVIVSGLHAAAGLVDLYYVMARSTWVRDKAELDRLVPAPGGITRMIARLIRNTL
jgi:phosphatidylserine/phosphatidylglycerophosphate/cardiolipin synthase-like enzyme